MRSLALAVAGLLLLVPLAGCLGDDDGISGGIDHARIAAAIGTPIEAVHDHDDALAHTGSHNVRQLAWSPLDVELGENGFANFVFHEEAGERLVVVAIDGDQRGGFSIADATDLQDIRVLGSYRVAGSGFQEVRVTPDGRYALMNVQELPSAATGTDCGVCIHIVDITDRTAPTLAGLVPVGLIGTHNLHLEEIGGELHVLYVGQPLYRPTPVGSNPPPGNVIHIARFVEAPTGPTLVEVGQYRYTPAYTDTAREFPHDVYAARHPLTDQLVMYASWWEGGAITVDISDPTMPVELDVYDDPAPSEVNAIHWFAPEERARTDGRVIAYSAPEIGELESGTGVIRSYDVTDPGSIQQLDAWSLPGDAFIPGAYVLSPHITWPDMDRGLLAVSHYHAGVWILDISDPSDLRALGYHMPVGAVGEPYEGPLWWKKPNFDPEGYRPNVYQARWNDELLWVTERGSGLYVLEYTGPVPGPVG